MPRRMAGYIGRAIEHHGLSIYSNVIYLRPDAGQRDLGKKRLETKQIVKYICPVERQY